MRPIPWGEPPGAQDYQTASALLYNEMVYIPAFLVFPGQRIVPAVSFVGVQLTAYTYLCDPSVL
jgi:hypothetical protein